MTMAETIEKTETNGRRAANLADDLVSAKAQASDLPLALARALLEMGVPEVYDQAHKCIWVLTVKRVGVNNPPLPGTMIVIGEE